MGFVRSSCLQLLIVYASLAQHVDFTDGSAMASGEKIRPECSPSTRDARCTSLYQSGVAAHSNGEIHVPCRPALSLRGGVGTQDLRVRAAAIRRKSQAAAKARAHSDSGARQGRSAQISSGIQQEGYYTNQETAHKEAAELREGAPRDADWDDASRSMEDDDSAGGWTADDRLEVEEIEGGMVRMRVFGGELEVPKSEIDTPLEGGECSFLFVAAAYGKEDLVRTLLDMGAYPQLTNDDGDTVLHVAAFKGQPSVLPALVQAGVHVNARNQFGATPLHAAANGGSEATVRALLDLHADPSATDQEGLRAAHHAEAAGHRRLLSLLAMSP